MPEWTRCHRRPAAGRGAVAARCGRAARSRWSRSLLRPADPAGEGRDAAGQRISLLRLGDRRDGRAGGDALTEASAAEAARLRAPTGLPVVVGFGIDGPEKARLATGLGARAGEGADGVVVGTAIVKAIESAKDAPSREAAVRDLVSGLRAGLDR